MKKLKAAVVGVGYLGRFHAQKYKAHPQVELVGVYDLNKEQAHKVADELQVTCFNQLEDIYGKIDIATIACSTQGHYEVAEKLLRNKIHLNIEKPITAELDQAKKLIHLAQENQVKLSVGHIERFNPAFVKWQKRRGNSIKYIEFERMGPFKLRGSDVSVLHDLMIHDLDLLLSMNPGVLSSVEACGACCKSKSFDWASVWLTFGNRLRVHLKASRVHPVATRVMRVYEADGQWTLNLNHGTIEHVTFGEGTQTSLKEDGISTEKVDALQKETEEFVAAVLQNRTPMITGEDGLAALSLVERIHFELSRHA